MFKRWTIALLDISYRWARRIVVLVIGTTVLLIGVVMTVAPGPAIVVIPLGLAILAIEFEFARRWLKRLRAAGDSIARQVFGSSHAAPHEAPSSDDTANAAAANVDDDPQAPDRLGH